MDFRSQFEPRKKSVGNADLNFGTMSLDPPGMVRFPSTFISKNKPRKKN
jgi:hypothetical protein